MTDAPEIVPWKVGEPGPRPRGMFRHSEVNRDERGVRQYEWQPIAGMTWINTPIGPCPIVSDWFYDFLGNLHELDLRHRHDAVSPAGEI
jgi:hypothetical protein